MGNVIDLADERIKRLWKQAMRLGVFPDEPDPRVWLPVEGKAPLDLNAPNAAEGYEPRIGRAKTETV